MGRLARKARIGRVTVAKNRNEDTGEPVYLYKLQMSTPASGDPEVVAEESAAWGDPVCLVVTSNDLKLEFKNG